MQLATYIQDLLYRYECVIIPGFGAFISQYHPARMNEETKEFLPPGKSIMFNRQLQTNDGILANYVASVEQCNYELALQRIRNFTATLTSRLYEGETVELSNIGSFSLNTEKSVQFNPSEKGNFSTASFGLSPVGVTAILREQSQTEIEDDKTPLLFTPETRTKTPYLRYAAVGLVALALSGFGGMKIYESGVKEHNFAEKQKAETLVESKIQEATFVIDDPLPALNIIVSKQVGNYHIVAGAFRIEANAHKKISQLTEKGFNAKLIGKNRYGLHQVIYNSYEKRLEALRALKEIKNTENKDAWLLVQDLNK